MPETTVDRVGPGRYLVKRVFELDGYAEELEIVCNNPAYGERQLDDQQLAMLEARRPKPAQVA